MEPTNMVKPAEALEGLDLPGGWHVRARLIPKAADSGGAFSAQYLVERTDGTPGFLKALDFTIAQQAPDLTVALQALTEAFNFERDLVVFCAKERMSRVVLGLDYGEADVPGFGLLSRVPYLIFERAERDARQHVDILEALDVAWVLRSLHHVTTGIRQLHYRGIAHQDLKPSNVLVLQDESSKVGDLGRASRAGHTAPHDALLIAGKKSYAPPELLYGYVDPDERRRRRACDLYQLGGLLHFFFSGLGATAALAAALGPSQLWTHWTGTYEQVLPYVRNAFDTVALSLRAVFPDEMREEMDDLFRMLCDPDPGLRGDRRAGGRGADRQDLQRFVSRFDALAVRAEILLRKTITE